MAGLGTRTLTLEIDDEEVANQISKGVVTSAGADADFVTFFDAKSGGKREYRLDFTAVQDPAAGSLWDLVWTSAGETVPFLMKPFGNEVPSVSQPHFTGLVTITEPDGDFIGGEADSSTSARFTIDCSWVCEGKPTRITS